MGDAGNNLVTHPSLALSNDQPAPEKHPSLVQVPEMGDTGITNEDTRDSVVAVQVPSMGDAAIPQHSTDTQGDRENANVKIVSANGAGEQLALAEQTSIANMQEKVPDQEICSMAVAPEVCDIINEIRGVHEGSIVMGTPQVTSHLNPVPIIHQNNPVPIIHQNNFELLSGNEDCDVTAQPALQKEVPANAEWEPENEVCNVNAQPVLQNDVPANAQSEPEIASLLRQASDIMPRLMAASESGSSAQPPIPGMEPGEDHYNHVGALSQSKQDNRSKMQNPSGRNERV